MRLHKDNHFSLLNTIKNHLNEETTEEVVEDEVEDIEEADEKDYGFATMPDQDMADLIIRYNQVVNRALRARFMSRTSRKSL